MNIITINSIEYYIASDLIETNKEYFKCCKSKIRSVIEWRKIPDTEYLFAYKKDDKWVKSKSDYKKASLLLKKSFCESTLPSMKPKVGIVDFQPETIQPEYKIKNAPEILELRDEEKFKDEQGNPHKIEVRGERRHDKIFFKVKDVATAFDMNRLRETILDSRYDGYEMGKHYVYFYSNGSSVRLKIKTLFLTYKGMIRLLFVSKNKLAEKFQDWATEILYTHQMGTQEQRKSMTSNLLGLPYGDMKKYLNIHTGLTYCIYLSILGKVSDLKDSMGIKDVDDNKYVCKFGKTDNLEQRVKNHKSEYKEIKGVNWTLKKITMIEPCNGFKAEKSLKQFVEPYKLDYQKREELVVLSLDEMVQVEEKMQNLRYMYGTQNQEFAGIIDDLNRTIEKERYEHKMEMKMIQYELKQKEMENSYKFKQYETELKIKDKEIENRDLKLEVYRLKYESK